MKRGYNRMKRRALAGFEGRGWLSPPDWAVLARYYPVQVAYTYLKHLWTWKLLEAPPRQARASLVSHLRAGTVAACMAATNGR